MKKITQFLVLLIVATLNAQTPIYQFDFNGNLNNSGTGTVTTGFVASGAVFYGAGRNGVANNAFNSSTELTGAILPNLPTGNSSRTLNVWVKFGSTNTTHYLMGWGSGSTANGGFTMYQSTATQSVFGTGGIGNWAAVNNTINTTSWYMFTYVYDGTTLKHYINGVQQSAITRNVNTVAGNNGLRLSLCRFLDDTSARLGNYLIDDASIYDVALTSAQITSLYTSTSAPAITNVTASNVTFNAATINFNLNAFGSATTYVVEYTTDVLGTWQTQNGGTTSVNASTPFQVQLSNLIPDETYFVRVKATNATSQVTTSADVQINIPTSIVLTNVNDSNVTATTAQINYTLNTNGYDALVEIRYQAGTIFDTDNPFTTRVITTAVNNTTATNYNYTLTGLTPNTTYSYQFGAVTQNAGGVETSENAAFATSVAPTQNTPIYHYKFSGNLNEENGGPALTLSPLTTLPYSFLNNSEILISKDNLNTTPFFTATLPNLPQGNSARTVSVRISYESGALASTNYLFSWGTTVNNQAYGFSQGVNNGNNYFWGSNDLTFSLPTNFATYYTLTFVYDGSFVSVYRDGSLLQQVARNLNTNGTILRIGATPSENLHFLNARIDDIQIFNTAFTQSQITSLNATLSSSDFNANNLKFSLYPNPANDILNIDSENELKSVEVYSLLGQKMLSSTAKQLSISNLASGIYMVRVEDENGAVATQKLVKE